MVYHSGQGPFLITLTANEIEAAMDMMIQRNIFLSPSGELTSMRDIRIVGTTIDDMYDPPQG
ncbi:DUF2922 domain-containing protein [Desulfitobacterium hafniense]|uniref:DUF2922 domain-containing protein n=1 Tax=Desulfitobacterium hafniense TaxID=49338 RepID=UPI001FA7571A|nr:DUF2922 domain-containing protein [Desulfitobacterium hafniense]